LLPINTSDASKFSDGEKSGMVCAAALAALKWNPQVEYVCFDEATSYLDLAKRKNLVGLIHRHGSAWCQSGPKTMVVIEQNANDLYEACSTDQETAYQGELKARG
jgi:energy-coupling factor transporter ATP-binding protein EcfA2